MKTAAEIIQKHMNKPENHVGVSTVITDAMKEYAKELIGEMISYRDPRVWTGPEIREVLEKLIQ